VHFLLGLLRQRGDLGGRRRRPLAGVEAVQRGEEAEPVGGAHGLLQVARLVQKLLERVVALHGAALDHLEEEGGGEVERGRKEEGRGRGGRGGGQ